MKRYIHASDDTDYGYGFDSNGDPIDESTVEELYRIANSEILPDTVLAETCTYCDIDEDSFEFHATGTAFGSDVTYTISATITDGSVNLMSFVRPDAQWIPDFNSERYSAEISLEIHVHNDDVTVEFLEADVYDSMREGADRHFTHSSYMSDEFREDFDIEAICAEIQRLAESAAREIHGALSNI